GIPNYQASPAYPPHHAVRPDYAELRFALLAALHQLRKLLFDPCPVFRMHQFPTKERSKISREAAGDAPDFGEFGRPRSPAALQVQLKRSDLSDLKRQLLPPLALPQRCLRLPPLGDVLHQTHLPSAPLSFPPPPPP